MLQVFLVTRSVGAVRSCYRLCSTGKQTDSLIADFSLLCSQGGIVFCDGSVPPVLLKQNLCSIRGEEAEMHGSHGTLTCDVEVSTFVMSLCCKSFT